MSALYRLAMLSPPLSPFLVHDLGKLLTEWAPPEQLWVLVDPLYELSGELAGLGLWLAAAGVKDAADEFAAVAAGRADRPRAAGLV